MPCIKPVSELRTYNKVLNEVSAGSPVFLTKNGCGKYAIIDIEEYEKFSAELKLLKELNKGLQSCIDEKPLTVKEVQSKFENKF